MNGDGSSYANGNGNGNYGNSSDSQGYYYGNGGGGMMSPQAGGMGDQQQHQMPFVGGHQSSALFGNFAANSFSNMPSEDQSKPDPMFLMHETASGALGSGTLAKALATLSQDKNKRPRSEKKPIPNEQKDDKYFERRRRNNDAAKKSRDARKSREDELAVRASLLERSNAVLRVQVHQMREEALKLRQMWFEKCQGNGGMNGGGGGGHNGLNGIDRYSGLNGHNSLHAGMGPPSSHPVHATSSLQPSPLLHPGHHISS